MASLSLLLFFSLLLFQLATSDVQQLLSFKAALPIPDVLPSWTHSGNPCNTFSGVSCTNGDVVVSVDLDDTLLDVDFRHVSSYLLSIKTIKTLSLRSANVTGSLSGAVKKCGFQLSSLDLSGNSIDGPVSDLVEACVGLKSLNLSRNGLSGKNVNDVSSGSGLETLDLSFNKIASEGFLKWVFESFTGLRHLDLSGNLLAGAVPVFSNCSSLQFLYLSTNSLTSTASDGLFASCEELRVFNLSSNSISGAAPAKMFGACRSLHQLDLSFNNFSGNLPEDLSACASLESISLSSNNFSGNLPVDVLTAMGNLNNLEFAYNHLAGPLPVVLFEKLPNLQVVDLSSNLLSGSIPADICKSSASIGLKELYLQNNLFRGHIPPSIGECRMLVCLDLSFNYLTGTIPDSVGGLSRLRDLHMWQNSLEGGIPPALNNITTLENLILDNNGLSGPIPDLRNCSNLNWISLASNRLTGPIPHWIGLLPNLAILKMGNNSLSGPIPPEIGDCKSLVWLDLNSNHLNGTIPQTIAKQSGKIAVGLVKGKRYVYLRNDGSSECHGSGNLLEFAGIRQEQLDRIPTRQSCNFTRVYMGSTEYTFNNNGSMLFVDLSYNQLEGEIPKEFGDMYYISILNLGHNALTGSIPREFGRLKFLGILDLSHNFITGSIPTSFATCAMLAEMDLSYNNLSGQIPDVGQLATFPPFRYANNPDLCGFPLLPCGANSTSDGSGRPKSHRRQASLAGSIAMGLLFALFCIFALIIIAIESKKRQRRKKENAANDVPAGRDVFFDSHWNSGVVGNSAWKLTSTREAMSINLAAFENPLRKLTFADLLEATNGFHDDSLIGSGGFGDVYKAQLKDGSVVAIKKLIHVSGQGDREFTAEMETIGKIKHRNLVPLLGYCKVGEERLLVYEYMKYGSLDDVLHNRKKGGVKLNWAIRRKIAVSAARGLAFLHHSCIPHIIHRDMKSSNVLLDESLEARVSDFGMARLLSAVDTHLSVSTLAGTPGYVPPEYYQSFRCSTKGDVYSYGVVLLELLTGRQPTDSVDFGDNNLVGWVKQHSKLRITDVFDPELLKEDPTLELELLEHLKIACSCLDDRPLRRPTMLKVMAMFKEIQAGSMVDSATTIMAGSVEGMVEMSLKECKEEKES